MQDKSTIPLKTSTIKYLHLACKIAQSQYFILLVNELVVFFMANKYPSKLKNKIKTYFKNKSGLDISENEAEEYLDSLADFYSSLKTLM